MTAEEIKNKIDECIETSDFYEDIDDFAYGVELGKIEVYQKWLKDLIVKEA